MHKKIILTLDLFNKTIELLDSLDDYLDIADCPSDTIQLYGYVMHTFKNKMSFIHRFNNQKGCCDNDNNDYTADLCFYHAYQGNHAGDEDVPF